MLSQRKRQCGAGGTNRSSGSTRHNHGVISRAYTTPRHPPTPSESRLSSGQWAVMRTKSPAACWPEMAGFRSLLLHSHARPARLPIVPRSRIYCCLLLQQLITTALDNYRRQHWDFCCRLALRNNSMPPG